MPNRFLLAASRRPAVKRLITSRSLTRRVAERFVAGDSLDDGVRASRELVRSGIGAILDYLGENVTNDAQADAAADAYIESLSAIAREGLDAHVSVKLTQLGLDAGTDPTVQRMEKICARAAEIGTTVAIDMESHEYTDDTIAVYRMLRANHPNVVLCLQAYLRRTQADIESLLPLDPAIRLCKGAYNEPADIAYGRDATRRAYRYALGTLLANTSMTAVATHDDLLIREAQRLGGRFGKERFEFQMLYGVRREMQSRLVSEGYRVRVYVPFGEEWYPYLTRRLAERPANLKFFLEALIRG